MQGTQLMEMDWSDQVKKCNQRKSILKRSSLSVFLIFTGLLLFLMCRLAQFGAISIQPLWMWWYFAAVTQQNPTIQFSSVASVKQKKKTQLKLDTRDSNIWYGIWYAHSLISDMFHYINFVITPQVITLQNKEFRAVLEMQFRHEATSLCIKKNRP